MKMHEVTITDMSEDESQRFNFLVDCKCGFQARTFTKADAAREENKHLVVQHNLSQQL